MHTFMTIWGNIHEKIIWDGISMVKSTLLFPAQAHGCSRCWLLDRY